MSINYIVIPASFESKRLPGKVLLEETGKPLIQHTWENALKAKYKFPDMAFEVIIATDNDEVEKRCRAFGATVMRTGRCKNGSERVAEVAKYLKYDTGFNTVTNLQADYPDIPITLFPALVADLYNAKGKYYINTLAYPSENKHEYLDKDKVKVVYGGVGQAVYFSRAPIPYDSDKFDIHVGVYTFLDQVLLQYDQIKNTPDPLIVTSENLEQNKWIAGGLFIHLIGYKFPINGINTPEDYQKFVREYKTLIQE